MDHDEQSGDDAAQLLAAAFSDTAGREHVARLDFVKLRMIRSQTGIDFGDLPQIGKAWGEFLWSDVKALDAVWLAISDDGHAVDGISKDDWLSAMDGVTLEAGRQAVAEAVENFTPPLRRKILLEGMGAVKKAYAEMILEAETRIKQEVGSAIERAVNKVRHGTPRPNARGSSVTSTSGGRSAKPTAP